MKKKKIDYKSIALFEMAKLHYKKADEFVNALFEHHNDKDNEADIWYPVIEQMDYDGLLEALKDIQKKNKHVPATKRKEGK